MHAIILSAGQGRRLLPHTLDLPKCLLPVQGDRPVLEIQLRALRDAGIEQARVMVGFRAEMVEAFLAKQPVPGIEVETHFNPFFDSSDNLVTAWLARSEMRGDFLLLNGDTLFETDVLRGLLTRAAAPITLVVNGKARYDADDMKVSIGPDGRIRAVSKTLDLRSVNGESIGLMCFRGEGVEAFRAGLDRAVRTARGMRAYYLSVIDELAAKVAVETSLMTGLWWGELDSPEDLTKLRSELASREADIAERIENGAAGPVRRNSRVGRDRTKGERVRPASNPVVVAPTGVPSA